MGRFCLSLKDRLVAKQVPVYAHVSFFEACSELIAPVTTKRAHVDALANLICSNVPGDGVAVDFEEDELQAAGAPYIKRLSIRRSDQPRITSGHTGSGRGFVFLDEKIRRKDDQLGRYRLNLPDADAFWLLMVAGTVHGGVLPQTATQYAYPTLFNRVFYFDLQRDIALELETTRRREGSTS